MSDYGAYQDDMGRLSNLSDRDLDRLLTGKAPLDGGDLEELAAFIRDVRVHFEVPPDEDAAARHLAAMYAAAESATSETTTSLDRERSTQLRSRRKFMLRNPLSSLRAKLATAVVAGVLALSAFGGAAYAGALPGPVQDAVAGVANNVGVSLPDSNDIDNGDVANVDEGQLGNTDDGAVSDTNDGALGNTDEGTVGDTNEGDQNNSDDASQGDQGQIGPNDQSGSDQNQGAGDQGSGSDQSGNQDNGGNGNN